MCGIACDSDCIMCDDVIVSNMRDLFAPSRD